MRIVFLVNDATALQPSQTTTLLIAAAITQGQRVWVVGVGDLSCQSDGCPYAWGRLAACVPGGSRQALVDAMASAPLECIRLDAIDLLMMRTNPARDRNRATLHDTALALAHLCQNRGVKVINRPEGLMRAASKLYLLEFPESVRPVTLVSQHPQAIRDFIQDLDGPAVLKPLQGTRGNDVFFVASPTDHNLRQIIEVISRQGPVMVQACLPDAQAGDTRVVMMKGEVLGVAGQLAAIRRVPGPGDFRSNLHAGGTAQPAVITPAMHQVMAHIGPKLMADGLFLVGLDFIGAKLLEINVFSTGGLHDAERFTGVSFAEQIVATLQRG
jgi:glutathione synthase